MFSNVGIIGLVVGYTIAGAFVFRIIEGGEGPPVNAKVLLLRNETALKLWQLSCCEMNVFSEVSRVVTRYTLVLVSYMFYMICIMCHCVPYMMYDYCFLPYMIGIKCRHDLYHVSLFTLYDV
jgi:hypothetical protein